MNHLTPHLELMIEKETRSGKRLLMKVKKIDSINKIYSILTSLT